MERVVVSKTVVATVFFPNVGSMLEVNVPFLVIFKGWSKHLPVRPFK